jgi:hypothetical protein
MIDYAAVISCLRRRPRRKDRPRADPVLVKSRAATMEILKNIEDHASKKATALAATTSLDLPPLAAPRSHAKLLA